MEPLLKLGRSQYLLLSILYPMQSKQQIVVAVIQALDHGEAGWHNAIIDHVPFQRLQKVGD
jgi:hypothetical protein